MRLFDLIIRRCPFDYHRQVVVPVFGTLFFLIGVVTLFLISAGRWRVRQWPRFNAPRRPVLEPTRVREGRLTYYCADAALFLGLCCTLVAGLVVGMCFLMPGASPSLK